MSLFTHDDNPGEGKTFKVLPVNQESLLVHSPDVPGLLVPDFGARCESAPRREFAAEAKPNFSNLMNPVYRLDDAAPILSPAKKVLNIEIEHDTSDLIVIVNGVEFVKAKK